ncbi:MAG: trypsin-like peptidase domain-containing protein, partial [Blautia sp.]|nr:trypsin-like peptidase domain-containing protein [Blautia sp.]
DYKTIVGTDDRIIISDPSRYPYSAIAYMDVHARCGCTWTGTGFMVGPSGMLTASHCLVCTQHGQTADIIDYYFGLQPNGSYYYKYSNEFTYWYGTNFSVGDGTYGYTDQNMEWDYGYIKLQERVGDTTGWFGLSAKDDFTLDGSYYEVAGYRDWQLKSDINLLTVSNSNLVTHLADTQPGNSGGPIFDFDNYAVAINVAENNTLSYNVGRRITSSLINEMRSHGLFE